MKPLLAVRENVKKQTEKECKTDCGAVGRSID
jgi:hypothetical protein